VLVIPLSLAAVAKDDAPSVTAVNSKVYDLETVGYRRSFRSFIENSDATVSIELELPNNSSRRISSRAHSPNNAADGGDIA
jgi:hypothetical protein